MGLPLLSLCFFSTISNLLLSSSRSSPHCGWHVNKVPSLSARNTRNACINMWFVKGRRLYLATPPWLVCICVCVCVCAQHVYVTAWVDSQSRRHSEGGTCLCFCAGGTSLALDSHTVWNHKASTNPQEGFQWMKCILRILFQRVIVLLGHKTIEKHLTKFHIVAFFYDPFYTPAHQTATIWSMMNWSTMHHSFIQGSVLLPTFLSEYLLACCYIKINFVFRVPRYRKPQYVSKGRFSFFVTVIHEANRPVVCTVSGEWFSNKSDPSSTIRCKVASILRNPLLGHLSNIWTSLSITL